MRVFLNTCTWEQQEWKKKETEEESMKRGASMKRSKLGMKKNFDATMGYYSLGLPSPQGCYVYMKMFNLQ